MHQFTIVFLCSVQVFADIPTVWALSLFCATRRYFVVFAYCDFPTAKLPMNEFLELPRPAQMRFFGHRDCPQMSFFGRPDPPQTRLFSHPHPLPFKNWWVPPSNVGWLAFGSSMSPFFILGLFSMSFYYLGFITSGSSVVSDVGNKAYIAGVIGSIPPLLLCLAEGTGLPGPIHGIVASKHDNAVQEHLLVSGWCQGGCLLGFPPLGVVPPAQNGCMPFTHTHTLSLSLSSMQPSQALQVGPERGIES